MLTAHFTRNGEHFTEERTLNDNTKTQTLMQWIFLIVSCFHEYNIFLIHHLIILYQAIKRFFMRKLLMAISTILSRCHHHCYSGCKSRAGRNHKVICLSHSCALPSAQSRCFLSLYLSEKYILTQHLSQESASVSSPAVPKFHDYKTARLWR